MYRLTTLIFVLTISIPSYCQKKIACIGNSITFGYGIEGRDTSSYPARLQQMMGNQFEVRNFGISARTMLKHGNHPYWNEPEFKQIFEFHPDICIIKLGTNDSKYEMNWKKYQQEFAIDYEAFIDTLKSLDPSPEFWICLAVPAYKEIWDISDQTIKNGVNPEIKKVALEKGVRLIDLYATMLNKKEMFLDDGIHPNAMGAEEMAKIINMIMNENVGSVKTKKNILIAPEAYDYQWYFNGNKIDETKGGKERNFKFSEKGEYKVSLKIYENNETRIIRQITL